MQGVENNEHRSQRLPAVIPMTVVAGSAAKGEDVTETLRRMLESCPVPPELLARIEAACVQDSLRDAS
jgi:DNA recombination-dependent growth factor C